MKILITGGGSGIGYETARQLASSAEHQLLVVGRTEAGLARLKTDVASLNDAGVLNYLVFDLNTSNTHPLENALLDLGGLDVLINNAGLLIHKPFEQLTPTDWQQSFATNFFAVVNLIKIALPFFPAGKQGHILNIGSMGGGQGTAKFTGLAAYSAAKAALANLTECLAEEFKEKHISVNCLNLGAVQTKMLAKAFPGYHTPVDSQSMGDFVAWFAIHGQRFFNGKVLPVSLSTP